MLKTKLKNLSPKIFAVSAAGVCAVLLLAFFPATKHTEASSANGTINVVVGVNGGTAKPSDFPLYISGLNSFGVTQSDQVTSGPNALNYVLQSKVTTPQKVSYSISANPGTYGFYTSIDFGLTAKYGPLYSSDCPKGKVTLLSGGNVTCTIVMTYGSSANLQIVTSVSGGTAKPSDFETIINLGSVVWSSLPGNSSGVIYSIFPDNFTVSEEPNKNYSVSFSGDCDSSGNVSLSYGVTKTCTITNTYKAASGAPPASSSIIIFYKSGTTIRDYTNTYDANGILTKTEYWAKASGNGKVKDILYENGEIAKEIFYGIDGITETDENIYYPKTAGKRYRDCYLDNSDGSKEPYTPTLRGGAVYEECSVRGTIQKRAKFDEGGRMIYSDEFDNTTNKYIFYKVFTYDTLNNQNNRPVKVESYYNASENASTADLLSNFSTNYYNYNSDGSLAQSRTQTRLPQAIDGIDFFDTVSSWNTDKNGIIKFQSTKGYYKFSDNYYLNPNITCKNPVADKPDLCNVTVLKQDISIFNGSGYLSDVSKYDFTVGGGDYNVIYQTINDDPTSSSFGKVTVEHATSKNYNNPPPNYSDISATGYAYATSSGDLKSKVIFFKNPAALGNPETGREVYFYDSAGKVLYKSKTTSYYDSGHDKSSLLTNYDSAGAVSTVASFSFSDTPNGPIFDKMAINDKDGVLQEEADFLNNRLTEDRLYDSSGGLYLKANRVYDAAGGYTETTNYIWNNTNASPSCDTGARCGPAKVERFNSAGVPEDIISQNELAEEQLGEKILSANVIDISGVKQGQNINNGEATNDEKKNIIKILQTFLPEYQSALSAAGADSLKFRKYIDYTQKISYALYALEYKVWGASLANDRLLGRTVTSWIGQDNGTGANFQGLYIMPGAVTLGSAKSIYLDLGNAAAVSKIIADLPAGRSADDNFKTLIAYQKKFDVWDVNPAKVDQNKTALLVGDGLTAPVFVYNGLLNNGAGGYLSVPQLFAPDPSTNLLLDRMLDDFKKQNINLSSMNDLDVIKTFYNYFYGKSLISYNLDAGNSFQTAGETLARGSGDCEDFAVLSGNLLSNLFVRLGRQSSADNVGLTMGMVSDYAVVTGTNGIGHVGVGFKNSVNGPGANDLADKKIYYFEASALFLGAGEGKPALDVSKILNVVDENSGVILDAAESGAAKNQVANWYGQWSTFALGSGSQHFKTPFGNTPSTVVSSLLDAGGSAGGNRGNDFAKINTYIQPNDPAVEKLGSLIFAHIPRVKDPTAEYIVEYVHTVFASLANYRADPSGTDTWSPPSQTVAGIFDGSGAIASKILGDCEDLAFAEASVLQNVLEKYYISRSYAPSSAALIAENNVLVAVEKNYQGKPGVYHVYAGFLSSGPKIEYSLVTLIDPQTGAVGNKQLFSQLFTKDRFSLYANASKVSAVDLANWDKVTLSAEVKTGSSVPTETPKITAPPGTVIDFDENGLPIVIGVIGKVIVSPDLKTITTFDENGLPVVIKVFGKILPTESTCTICANLPSDAPGASPTTMEVPAPVHLENRVVQAPPQAAGSLGWPSITRVYDPSNNTITTSIYIPQYTFLNFNPTPNTPPQTSPQTPPPPSLSIPSNPPEVCYNLCSSLPRGTEAMSKPANSYFTGIGYCSTVAYGECNNVKFNTGWSCNPGFTLNTHGTTAVSDDSCDPVNSVLALPPTNFAALPTFCAVDGASGNGLIGSVDLSWTAPAGNSNVTLQNYKLYADNFFTGQIIPGSASSFTYSTGEAGVARSFSLTAVYKLADGSLVESPQSNVSAVTTPYYCRCTVYDSNDSAKKNEITYTDINKTVYWEALPAGGSGNYSYNWIAPSDWTGAFQEKSISYPATAAGNKNSSVTITDTSANKTSTVSCGLAVSKGAAVLFDYSFFPSSDISLSPGQAMSNTLTKKIIAGDNQPVIGGAVTVTDPNGQTVNGSVGGGVDFTGDGFKVTFSKQNLPGDPDSMAATVSAGSSALLGTYTVKVESQASAPKNPYNSCAWYKENLGGAGNPQKWQYRATCYGTDFGPDTDKTTLEGKVNDFLGNDTGENKQCGLVSGKTIPNVNWYYGISFATSTFYTDFKARDPLSIKGAAKFGGEIYNGGSYCLNASRNSTDCFSEFWKCADGGGINAVVLREAVFTATVLSPIIGPISASCSVSSGIQHSPADVQVDFKATPTVTWTANAYKGKPPYSFAWSGDAPLAGKGGQTASFSYPSGSLGAKRGQVIVTDGSSPALSSGLVDCGNKVVPMIDFAIIPNPADIFMNFVGAERKAVSVPRSNITILEDNWANNVTLSVSPNPITDSSNKSVPVKYNFYNSKDGATPLTAPFVITPANFLFGLYMTVSADGPISTGTYPITITGTSAAPDPSNPQKQISVSHDQTVFLHVSAVTPGYREF